ncbi:hypothetical protein LQF12_01965 [Ruania suaedae]|uniref:hypothetical protein n=1 Tax=Ruania suaedae TaxID=2897774 RepID=UPI001E54FAE6|nr:hypothetical protein [Ruania suaedae]UFU03399.1 hypothetical protein LQF12_01965 [Ruania suaedae]
MSTVPPNDRDDRDPTAAPDEATATGTTPETAGGPREPGTLSEPSTTDHTSTPAGTGTTYGEHVAGADHREPVADPAPATPPASTHTPPTTPVAGPGRQPATRQLPTEDEDAALRDERARRFGRPADEPGTGPGPAPATAPVAAEPVRTEPAQDDPFSDWDDGPRSRAAAHWWGILIALIFAPVSWYLLTDGGERIAFSLENNLDAVNVAGLVELAGGLICVIVLLLAARWSSVGSIIVGSIGALIGAAFLAVPAIVNDFLTDQAGNFDRLGQFGRNVSDHLVAEGHAGRLLLYGVVLIFLGVISHGARRQGRREERRKIATEV